MLNEVQIIRWISIREVALCLMHEYEPETSLSSCENCDLCLLKIDHRCIRNFDSIEGHAIKFNSDTTWECERGPVEKMIAINNDQIDLVVSIKGVGREQAINWINEQIEDKTCRVL